MRMNKEMADEMIEDCGIVNEYKVVFYNHNISDGYIQVIRGILAKSDNHAIETIMDTWDVSKNWIISTSTIKLNGGLK